MRAEVMAAENPSSPSPAARRKSRAWRVLRRLAVAALALYILVGIILFFLQPVMIFPGAYVHREDGAVRPSPDYQLLELRTADGHQVAAVFGNALDGDGAVAADAARRPTLLFFYGNGDCIATSMGLFDEFRRLGANVLIPEYVGYPLSTGTPSDRGCCQTADAAYAYLSARCDVDRRQIFVIGRSIGSGPAIDLASRRPVAGLVTISAFTSLDEMAHKVVPIYPTSLVLRTHFNNCEKIAAVRCPILMMHGTADTFVPFAMMSSLSRCARAPVSLYSIDGADHNSVFEVGGSKLLDRIDQFVKDVDMGTVGGAAADRAAARRPLTLPSPGSP
jgi:fermentation-respiration switch protein FrsA (DUF1100 family)